MTEPNNSEFDAAFRRGLEAREPIEIGGVPHMLVPNDMQLQALDHLLARPRRTSATFRAGSPEGFVEYVNRFSTQEETVIFVNKGHGVFKAVFDYHELHGPNWCQHTAVLQLRETPEWADWMRNDRKAMTQEDFAEFLEDHVDDIAEPSGADMLEIARTLQANTSIKFRKGIRLENGNIDLQYTEEVDGRAGVNGSLAIPSQFSLGIALFEGTPRFRVEARFKYRIRDGNALLRYELVKPHRVVEEVVDDARDSIESAMIEDLPFYEEA